MSLGSDPSRPEPNGLQVSESAQARRDMTGWPVTGPGPGGCRAVQSGLTARGEEGRRDRAGERRMYVTGVSGKEADVRPVNDQNRFSCLSVSRTYSSMNDTASAIAASAR